MVANTWIAAAPGDWSDDANWSLGHKPIAGEDPTFDGTSVNNCNANDATPTGVLTIAAGYSGTITQSSDMYISGYSQSGGTFTGVTTKWVYCDGDFYITTGTITSEKLRLNMLKNETILSGLGFIYYELKISADVNYTHTGTRPSIARFTLDNDCQLNIIQNKILGIYYGDISFFNYGHIVGLGTLQFDLRNFDEVVSLGNISCPLVINGHLSASVNRKFTIEENSIVNNNVTILSPHATNTCTLDLNGHSLTASSIIVGTRGILQCGEGTITTSALDSSAGTIIEETATWIFERGSTIKVAAAQKLYNVIAKGSSALKLLSNLGISGLFAHPAEIDRNGFTLTLDQPDKEYAGLRRPIIVPVKKLDIGEVGLLDSWLRDLGGLL